MDAKRYTIPCVAIVLVGGAVLARSKITTSSEQHETMQRGGAEAAQHILDSGADVNEKEVLGQTPLMLAARAGKADQVKAMIAKGANVNAADDSGKTTFAWTMYMYRISLDQRYAAVARTLIDNGLDVDRRDQKGKTNLMIALNSGALETASDLIDKGADAKAKDSEGHTPLHWALRGKTRDQDLAKVVNKLLKKGGDPNAKGPEGRTPLSIAEERKMAETARVIKAAGGK